MGDATFPHSGLSGAGIQTIQWDNLTTGMPTCFVDTDAGNVNAAGTYVNGAADADVAHFLLWRIPAPLQIMRCKLVPKKASVGIDDSNTCQIEIEKYSVAAADLGNVCERTLIYNTAANTPIDLCRAEDTADAARADGATSIVADNAKLTTGQQLRISITQGTTADLDNAVGANATCFGIQVDYVLLDQGATVLDA